MVNDDLIEISDLKSFYKFKNDVGHLFSHVDFIKFKERILHSHYPKIKSYYKIGCPYIFNKITYDCYN